MITREIAAAVLRNATELRDLTRQWQERIAEGNPPSREERLDQLRSLQLGQEARMAGLAQPPAFDGSIQRFSEDLERWAGRT